MGFAPLLEVGQHGVVAVVIGQEYCADGRHQRGRNTPSAEHGVYKASAGTPVAIYEGMDALELRVHDRCLGDSGHVIPVGELDEVVEKSSDHFRWRRVVEGVARL